MNQQNQYTAIKMFGAFVASRKIDKDWVFLYQIDAFYVEVIYDSRGSNAEIVRSFKSTNMLKPYLDKINLESLLIGI